MCVCVCGVDNWQRIINNNYDNVEHYLSVIILDVEWGEDANWSEVEDFKIKVFEEIFCEFEWILNEFLYLYFSRKYLA